MIEGGEDPRFIARRMVVLASEDIGNADPRALEVAVNAAHAVEHVGMPECALNLAQAAVYLASQAAKVWLLVSGDDLEASMSRNLVDRIAGLANVEVLTQTSVTGLEGRQGVLEAIRWRRGA